MVCLQVCRRGLSIAMLLSTLSVFPRTDCRELELQTDGQSLTVVNGVESNIDFFLPDYRSLNVSLGIIVQHRSTDGHFNQKCQIDHSASGVCQPTLGPCECVGQSSGSYRYRLRMNFTEQDGGQWLFNTVGHGETHVNITVIPRRAFKIYTKSPSLSVEDGETSNIDFFLNDTTAVDSGVTIVVQHQRVGGLTFDPKCRIAHSKKGGCQILFGPCECIGERLMTYQYRLKMIFTEQDGGMWMFDILNHEGTIVNITVNGSITSSQAHQTTESLQVTVLTLTIESYTLSTTTLVILTITVIVIFIISLIAVRCHSRTHHQVIGKAGSLSEEQYEDPGWMEQGQCEVQSSMKSTSSHVQSAHHREQTSETSENVSGSLKEEETIDFRKSIDSDADSVTSTATATAPPTPELPPRLYTSCLTFDLVS